MKKIATLSVLAVLGLALCSWAQPVPGKRFELSTSASFMSVKYKDSTESSTIVNLPIRVGIFLYKGLALEPEVVLTIPDQGSAGILALVNLAYNFNVKGKLVPFILAGAGYGNGQEMLNFVGNMDTGITALNVGAGVKFLVSDSAAIRLEYRFVSYSGKKTETYSSWTYTYDYGRTDHKILIGISLFL